MTTSRRPPATGPVGRGGAARRNAVLEVVGLVVAVLVVAAGCSLGGASKEDSPVDPHAALLARPSFEDTVARYQQMQQRIQTELDAALGHHDWITYDKGSPGNCIGAFVKEYDGKVLGLPQFGFTGNIPDDQWPRAEQIVAAIIGEYGFDTTGRLTIDQPGRHELNGRDPVLGADFVFGTQGNTVSQTTTGCHLPRAERPPA